MCEGVFLFESKFYKYIGVQNELEDVRIQINITCLVFFDIYIYTYIYTYIYQDTVQDAVMVQLQKGPKAAAAGNASTNYMQGKSQEKPSPQQASTVIMPACNEFPITISAHNGVLIGVAVFQRRRRYIYLHIYIYMYIYVYIFFLFSICNIRETFCF